MELDVKRQSDLTREVDQMLIKVNNSGMYVKYGCQLKMFS